MERFETKQLLKDMNAIYPSFKWSNTTVEMWHEVLKPFDYTTAKNSLIHLARTVNYMPNAGTIANDIKSRPQFELLAFNDRMFVIRVFIRDDQNEDSVFNFSYRTRDSANEALEKLKAMKTYEEVLEVWKQREFGGAEA